jgi:hypothetical protein
MLASSLSGTLTPMAKKRTQPVEAEAEVPLATYDDSESLIPEGSAPTMPAEAEPIPDRQPEEPPVVPHHDWFRTTTPGRVFVDGVVCHLAVGSLVSEATHDLERLRASGVRLEPCERIQRNLDAYGETGR